MKARAGWCRFPAVRLLPGLVADQVLLLGAIAYLGLVPIVAFGSAAVLELVGDGDLPRRVFMCAAVLALLVAFAITGRLRR